METFFNPRSIAVVGASGRKTGLQLIRNLLHGFTGALYPVNPRYNEIEGLPCYPDIESIPEPVDLAVMLVPAPAVPALIDACARKAIGRVMLLSAGFAEVGDQGAHLQAEVKHAAEKAGIRIWGPNCMGLLDAHRGHYFTFMSPRSYASGLPAGGVSLVVQSGMLLDAFLDDILRTRRIGVAKVCSIGNKMDIDECDLIEYLLRDDRTAVIALYLEAIGRGQRFAELVRKASKPIVLLKGGRSEAGAKAAMSHTSSLAGDSRLAHGVLSLSGVVPAGDFHQMLDMAAALSDLPPLRPGCRCAVATFSGGAGILACDLLTKHGLRLADFDASTKRELDALFPEWMPAGHPVDLYPAMERHGHAQAFDKALSIIIDDANVDCVFVHYVALNDDTYPDLAELQRKASAAGKAVIFWLLQRRAADPSRLEDFRTYGIPVFNEMSRAVECLAAATRFRDVKQSTPRARPLHPAQSEPGALLNAFKGVLDEYDSKKVLGAIGLPVTPERLVETIDQARQAADDIGYPVVLKGLDPGRIHKTESGLVRLNITDRPGLDAAFNHIRGRITPQGRVLIQRQVSSDYEVIVGFVRDPSFGPCVMFGIGGVFSELEPDVGFAPASLDLETAARLIRSIRKQKLFNGFRGLPPLDKEAMAEVIVRLGALGIACGRIEQIDVNPLCVVAGKPVAVDATIVLQS